MLNTTENFNFYSLEAVVGGGGFGIGKKFGKRFGKRFGRRFTRFANEFDLFRNIQISLNEFQNQNFYLPKTGERKGKRNKKILTSMKFRCTFKILPR